MREARSTPSRATVVSFVVVVVVVGVVVVIFVDPFMFGGVDEHRTGLWEAKLCESSVSTIEGEKDREEGEKDREEGEKERERNLSRILTMRRGDFEAKKVVVESDEE